MKLPMKNSLCLGAFLLLSSTQTLLALEGSDTPTPNQLAGQVKLAAGDGTRDDYFGAAVAADLSTVLVGVPYDVTGFDLEPGAVYAYVRDSNGAWSEQAKLLSSDGQPFDAFGYAIDVQGDVAVIGTPFADASRGATYVFARSGSAWSQVAKLLASDGTNNDYFGSAVAISGNTIAIGAYGDNTNRGSVYVFTGSGATWTQQQRLSASDASSGDNLGISVDIDADSIIAGANLDDLVVNNDSRGSAYVFVRAGSSWSQQSKLTLSSAANGDQFGSSVSLRGDTALVGAPFANPSGLDNAGVVAVFNRISGAWLQHQQMTAPTPTLGASFGVMVSMRSGHALVGAQSEAVAGMSSRGAAYELVLQNGAWAVANQLLATDGVEADFFGSAVALSEEFAVVGAQFADVGSNPDQGAAYAFVNLATQTVIGAVSPSPSVVGQSYLVPVSVSSAGLIPGGTVQVSDGAGANCSITLSAGTGSCSLISTTVGEKTLTARYGGAAGFAISSDTAVQRVNADLQLAPSSLPAAQQGMAYSASFSVSGSGYSLPVSYTLAAGSLPQGITLSATGLLSGTPSVAGDYPISVRVTDSSAVGVGGPFSSQRNYVLVVEPVFTTSLTLQQDNTVIDRGSTQTFAALLDVVEAGGPTPTGTYTVVATHAASSVNCSVAVNAEGEQACSILFPTSQPAGLWSISASFVSNDADLGGSSDSASHRVQRPVDVAVTVSVDRSLYLAGQVLTYTLQISNVGSDEAQDVDVDSLIGAGSNGLDWTCAGNACAAVSGTGNLNEQLDLPVGSSAVYTLHATISAPAVDSIQFSASAAVSLAGLDRELNEANNAAAVTSQHRRLFGNGFED
ncbi:MAG: putative Ig domain protein [Alphaproteobacteria bacterium ADurb.BinA280]|nr:MAG: putative Ig domain protein [Alphaproteobacteria bacterium ADurb.BinA280]